ncbi:MAG: hypothetical protein CSA62_00995 [Planctomycetota bacterium]|nr:MAG: hypothetical protein CSA62_00995 [Planctomycetota bacterium]
MFLALCTALSAQGNDPRDSSYACEWYAIKDASGAVTESGCLLARRGTPLATLKWSLFGQGEVQKTLPFYRVGSLQKLTDDIFLVSGSKNAQQQEVGILCLARLTRSPVLQIAITDVREVANLDMHRVAWNPSENLIYALNLQAKTVHVSAWAGPGHPFPAAFGTILSGAAVPYSYAWTWTRMKVDPGVAGFRMKSWDLFPFAWVRSESGNWVVTFDPSLLANSNQPVCVKASIYAPCGASAIQGDSSVVAGPKAILIAGPAGSCDLLDSSGAAIASYSLSQSWQYESFDLPASVNAVPGLPLGLRIPGSSVPEFWFRPTVRFGAPVAGGDLRISRGGAWSEHCAVGSSDYKVTASHEVLNLSAQERNAPHQLWLGFRQPSGFDPVDVVGSVAILRPDLIYSGTTKILADAELATSVQPIAIPADPSMAGVVLLYQWVVSNPDSSVTFSDVFGTAILPAAAPRAAKSKANARSALAGLVAGMTWKTSSAKAKEDLLSSLRSRLFLEAKRAGHAVVKNAAASPEYRFFREAMLRQVARKR